MQIRARILIAIILLTNFTLSSQTIDISKHKCRATIAELELNSNLSGGYNDLFAGSGECILCHNSMTNAQGEAIGILNDWRSTMMANAAKDPFWRAKVSHETLVDPDHSEALENICTSCHAPQGNFNAHFLGEEFYSIAMMENDSLALDGVSCTLCHQIKSETLGTYSGNLLIGTAKQIWGLYQTPFVNPMINNTGYTPAYGEHIAYSQLCGTCHTLITNSVDLEGEPTGEEFVEQAIYHEWLNSNYPAQGQSCQSCHVPRIDDIVKISTMPPWLDGRSPFGLHHLAGANIFIQKILKNNIEELGITADPVQFDSTISRTTRLLKESTLEISLSELNRNNDTLFLELELKNLAGHKFPAGFPSRRAFVEILLLSEQNDTLFHTGEMDENLYLVNEDTDFEKHHFMINSEEQVQIYEMVMGDINGDVTTILERAYQQLKDNRLPPTGFTTNHYSYDTVEIAGMAYDDENFNKQSGIEGTGSDMLYIHAPLLGYSGKVTVEARVFYQTVSAKWLENMFTYSSPEIDAWKAIYENSDRQPIIVGESILTSLTTSTTDALENQIALYPNPSNNRVFVFDSKNEVTKCEVYQLNGKKIWSTQFTSEQKVIDFNGHDGIFLINLITRGNESIIKKVVLN